MALAEGLLCAGADGDVVSAALVEACAKEFYEMVDLLISYGASVEFQDAAALRTAIARGQSSLVQLLLNEKTPLSPIYASEFIEHIPKTIAHEDRYAMLSVLLRKGAGGPPLDDALVDAVQAGDVESAKLLLTPHFPGGQTVESHDNGNGPRGMVYERHETASVDHRSGLALQIAVAKGHVPMVQQLLKGNALPETLVEVFPGVRDLPPAERYQMTECLLSAGLAGPCVSAALQEAIREEGPQRDERIIQLLLKFNADVNIDDGACILSAIAQGDADLLEILLKSGFDRRIAASAILEAMRVDDHPVRYRMISLLVEAAAGRGGAETCAQALAMVLQDNPLDMDLLNLLLDRGKPDINHMEAVPIIHGELSRLCPRHRAVPSLSLTSSSPPEPRSRNSRSSPPKGKPHNREPERCIARPVRHAH
jgi:ankyrin repeat protein